MSQLVLEVFPGGFDLPTLDLDCLIALTYCRLAGVPIRAIERHTIFPSSLPALSYASDDAQQQQQQSPQLKWIGSRCIIEYLNSIDYNLDANLDKDVRMDINSYVSMVEDKLRSCLHYLWWYDLDNFNQFVRGAYAQRLAFPANFYVPSRIRKSNIFQLELKYTPQVLERDSIGRLLENDVINQARYCLNLLQPYIQPDGAFFNASVQPTSLDVHLFAHLALLYKVPCKNETIKHHIGASEPLVGYIDHIRLNYLDQFKSSSPSFSPFDSVGDDGNAIKWKDVLLSSSLAATLMMIYALYK